jgi:membrane protein implicated in regulation of membrane protease activity
MLWRAILVVFLTVAVFLVFGILAGSPELMDSLHGLWLALVAAVLVTVVLTAVVRQYRHSRRLRGEVSKWKTRVQGKIWRGY